MATLRLMGIFAHPDDESLGTGGTLAKYAAEGVDISIVCATRGEAGRIGEERPGPEIAGPIREQELRNACDVLGVSSVHFLDYLDGQLDQAPPAEAIAKIVGHLRTHRPQVILTFDQYGGYGHPDHIAISQFALAACTCAADPNFTPPAGFEVPSEAHRVEKAYFMAWSEAKWRAYQHAFGELKFVVDGVERFSSPWKDWAVTTVLDTSDVWEQVWKAVSCHESQIAGFKVLAELPEEMHAGLWGSQEFYRVFSTVNGGREVETDLFEGLRH